MMTISRSNITRLATRIFLVNLFVYLLVGWFIYHSWSQYEHQTALSTQNLALSLELNVLGVLDKTDVSLMAVVNEAQRQLAVGATCRRTPRETPRLWNRCARCLPAVWKKRGG